MGPAQVPLAASCSQHEFGMIDRRRRSIQEEEDVTRVGDFWGRCAAAALSAAAKTLPAGGQLDQPGSCGCSSSMLYSLRLAFLNFVLYVSVERALRRTAAVAPAAATPQCSSAAAAVLVTRPE